MTEGQSTRRIRRCAIYTRKSSEEGLEQGFNSLDAQREACAAYITSQKAEGWRSLSTLYDDGGYSGGTMERPGLKRLMADIMAGRIDVVVVYKIDRLTRALADFARMVELFDRHEVSFVSVTQAFSTTTSMGRLTLNVLLSFAQFEREVTGERIRDKIAASKQKGMWMGGTLPLGFDRPDPGTRMLRINEQEAHLVRAIFARYLDLGSVHALERELAEQGVCSKVTPRADGTSRGGVAFSRGALFHLLRNRLYLGEIPHKGQSHPGLHAAIVSPDLFEAVQMRLDAQSRSSRAAPRQGVTASPLTGRIEDAEGQPMSPTFAYGRTGKLYRYYVSTSLQQGGRRPADDPHPRRVPAPLLEDTLVTVLTADRPSCAGSPLDRISRVILFADRLIVILQPEPHADADSEPRRLMIPFQSATGARRIQIAPGTSGGPRRDPALIRALRQAHARLERDAAGGPILEAAPAAFRARRILRLAFLSPDLHRAILEGNQPRHLTLAQLIDSEIPLLWSDQHRLFSQHS